MQIIVNGLPRQEAADISVAQLLQSLAMDPRRVAVELNKQIVPRAQYGLTPLGEGDQLEIVTLVGGG